MWQKIVEYIQNLLVPEDLKIQNLLNLSQGTMRDLLPKSPVYMKDVFVLFDYRNKIVKLIVRSIKYKNNARMKKRVAAYLYEEITEMVSDIVLFEGELPLLIPVPMSKKEKRKRGFNQSEELIKEIEKIANGEIEISYNILRKVKETERQTGLNKNERLLNVKNSMRVATKKRVCEQDNEEYFLKNRVVIILDDVYTTLATFNEARRALLAQDARRVIGLFIAH